MRTVYVLENVVRYQGSHIIDVYESWEALLYGIGQHYPVPTDEPIDALLTTDETDEHGPVEWSTPDYGLSDEEWLRVTKRTVRTATKTLHEVRVRYTNPEGRACDDTFRSSDTISDESHATALASGWNDTPPWGMPKDAEFYVKALV